MKLLPLLFGAALVFSAAPALAAPSCYAPAQMRAEHLLRFHSELMVITVTCRQASDGRALTPAYTYFTRKNVSKLQDAEQTMMAYYKSNKKGNPVQYLDSLRTRLGNEAGQKVAKVSAPVFCATNRDKVVQFAAATGADVDSQVQRMEATERSFVAPCKIKTAMTRKGN